MGYSRRSMLAIAAAAIAAIGLAAPAHAQKTLRAVMHSDLKILDPIWTTAYIVRNHGYMIYDTLFCHRREGRDQAADGRQVRGRRPTSSRTPSRCATASPGTTAQPVTAEDCVASHQALGGQGLRPARS